MDVAHGRTVEDQWDERVLELWNAMNAYEPHAFVAKMKTLASELPAGEPRGLYETASAYDSTGLPEEAEPLYRLAIASGLIGSRRRQAVIQLASTLRNLGNPAESIALLSAERETSDELDDAVSGFLALALADAGREREGLAIALERLATHLTRYKRSLTNYARELDV